MISTSQCTLLVSRVSTYTNIRTMLTHREIRGAHRRVSISALDTYAYIRNFRTCTSIFLNGYDSAPHFDTRRDILNAYTLMIPRANRSRLTHIAGVNARIWMLFAYRRTSGNMLPLVLAESCNLLWKRFCRLLAHWPVIFR